ncbi:hypothetical protein [Tuwongella immobilis]|uniref:hypothetical protein n=1 Tax=Tuwongella immobilis TaxID=692036 RepID=UPI0013A6E99F|nr:hypothetical protein [Tuwongella immobilis]
MAALQIELFNAGYEASNLNDQRHLLRRSTWTRIGEVIGCTAIAESSPAGPVRTSDIYRVLALICHPLPHLGVSCSPVFSCCIPVSNSVFEVDEIEFGAIERQPPSIRGVKKPEEPEGPDPAELFEQIGRLKVELEWVKKKAERLA